MDQCVCVFLLKDNAGLLFELGQCVVFQRALWPNGCSHGVTHIEVAHGRNNFEVWSLY